LYLEKYCPSKEIKLGIVCNKAQEDLKRVCERNCIKVFVFEEEKKSYKEGAICGVCEGGLVDRDGKPTCERCEEELKEFVGTLPYKTCECGITFTYLPGLERRDRLGWFLQVKDFGFWQSRCPVCRKLEFNSYYGGGKKDYVTDCDIVKYALKKRAVSEVEEKGIPKNFINLCREKTSGA
jgi:hypothetical protein